MALALVSAFVLMAMDYSDKLIWFVPVGVIALCYTLTVIPYQGGWVRLRDVPYLKVFLIVATVTYVTFCLPFLYYGWGELLFRMPITLSVLSRALFLFAITLPFDIRDLDFDRNTNLTTIPGSIGVNNTKAISLVLLALFLVAESISYFQYGGRGAVYVALVASGIVAAAFVVKAKPNGSEYFYSLGLEGTMIVQLLLVVLAMQPY